ncbi:MAG: TfoX/Sxy family protein [Geminicoccaceae bacterium]|nr:TfoX/Sxy family protein [Geminicoccaceae bacterium]
MPRHSPGLDHAVELLHGIGGITTKRMFGGHGIFVEDRMFALIAHEQLYLKVDDQTRDQFEEAGCEPFAYATKNGQTRIPSYMTAPDEALDDAEAMHPWAELAIAAAMRAKATARKPRRKSGRSTGATIGDSQNS